MTNWTIKRRISVGFAAVLFLLTALAATSTLLLQRISKNIHSVVDDALPGTAMASQIDATFSDEHLAIWRSIVAHDADDRKSQLDTVAKDAAEIDQLMGAYQATIFSDEDRQNYERLKQALAGYAGPRDKMVSFATTGAPLDPVFAYNTATFHPAHAALAAALDAFYRFNITDAQRIGRQNQSTLSLTQSVVLIGSAAAIAIGIGFAVFTTLGLGRTIRRVTVALDEGSDQVAAASSQVASASQSLASGISQQAASLEETSAALEEMSGLTKRNAENAHTAKELSSATRSAADSGATQLETMNSAMTAIKSSSDNIARIIKTIDEIAFQTNILALNAAVEAARAGEAGMGFAVVADEVRSLAQRSAQAAKETAEKIEDSIAKSEQGVRISADVYANFQQIVAKARKVDDLLGEIATASSEQSQGISEVNRAMSEMDKLTQGGAAGAEESASAAEELRAQARSLKDVVAEMLALSGSGAAEPGATGSLPARSVARRPEAGEGRTLQRPKLASGKAGANGKAGAPEPAPALEPASLAGTLSSRGVGVAIPEEFKDF